MTSERFTRCMFVSNEMLAPPSIETQTPGVNGIKVYNNPVYISNTGKMTIIAQSVQGVSSSTCVTMAYGSTTTLRIFNKWRFSKVR